MLVILFWWVACFWYSTSEVTSHSCLQIFIHSLQISMRLRCILHLFIISNATTGLSLSLLRKENKSFNSSAAPAYRYSSYTYQHLHCHTREETANANANNNCKLYDCLDVNHSEVETFDWKVQPLLRVLTLLQACVN